MLICSKCHVPMKDVCPICEHSKYAREAEGNEPVLLIVLTAVQSMMVEPILEDSGVPYSRPGTLGSALSAYSGSMLESNRFYVPVSAYGRCRKLIEEVFGEDEEIMRALNEFAPEEEVCRDAADAAEIDVTDDAEEPDTENE